MSWHPVIRTNELSETKRHNVTINGKKILIFLHEQEIYAVEASCPHLKLPLLKSKINSENELVCPFHRSRFDIKTGAVKCWSPWPAVVGKVLGKISKPKTLEVYPTKVEEEQIFIKL